MNCTTISKHTPNGRLLSSADARNTKLASFSVPNELLSLLIPFDGCSSFVRQLYSPVISIWYHSIAAVSLSKWSLIFHHAKIWLCVGVYYFWLLMNHLQPKFVRSPLSGLDSFFFLPLVFSSISDAWWSTRCGSTDERRWSFVISRRLPNHVINISDGFSFVCKTNTNYYYCCANGSSTNENNRQNLFNHWIHIGWWKMCNGIVVKWMQYLVPSNNILLVITRKFCFSTILKTLNRIEMVDYLKCRWQQIHC